ncbi:YrhB domain-containing protein [Streptomyces sp. NPDC058572]|uniref:YrhB domain-containing protein n=1 Tax=Streptomyces sp. NPDC058572 TaxID=3346546 RepID=UPI00365F95F3
MIEQEFAVRLVETQLEREYRAELALYGTSVHTVVAGVTHHELGWIIGHQSAEYLRTGNGSHALAGNGPYLVDGNDGSVHRIAAVDLVTGAWEDDHRVRYRGEDLPQPLDDLVAELLQTAATRGRVHAVRLLRQRVPAFTVAEAQSCVTALEARDAFPSALAVRAAEALPQPPRRPVPLGVEAVTGPNPPTGELPAPALAPSAPHRRRQGAERCRGNLLGDFRELRGRGEQSPSIHDAAGTSPRPGESELAAYLRAGAVLAASPSLVHDELRGDGTVICGLSVQTDGTWFWYSDLAYYVETYHLALDDRFLAHAASLGWRPPRPSDEELFALKGRMTP